ncbi:MAG: hypothetical protein RIA63_08740, partial [Cyclobacteriaceae bacterium]
MKWFQVVFLFFLVSCESSVSVDTSVANEAIPAGAVADEFADTPGLSKVTINDGSGNLAQTGLV